MAVTTGVGEEIPNPPWPYEGKVKCQFLSDSRYDAYGADEILDPPEYNEPWRWE
jgi:hypothetical protein